MRHLAVIFLLLALIGCVPANQSLVCRHIAMAQAAWAEEMGLSYKIVVYRVGPVARGLSLGAYDAHAQTRTEKGWVSNTYGLLSLSPKPEYEPQKGEHAWQGEYTAEQYMKMMRRNCFNGADCRKEGVPYE